MAGIDDIEQLDELVKYDVFDRNLALVPFAEFSEEQRVENGRVERQILKQISSGVMDYIRKLV